MFSWPKLPLHLLRLWSCIAKGLKPASALLAPPSSSKQRGHFWGLIETRPYMRARAGLARALWQCGEYDQAIMNWNDLLRLNTGDNLGIRYVLAARLLELGRDRRTRRSCSRRMPDDGRAYLIWAVRCSSFAPTVIRPNHARLSATALASNPHVPAYLLGHKPLRTTPRLRYMGPGDDSEAAYWAAETIKSWAATPGALAWLTQHGHAKPTLLH